MYLKHFNLNKQPFNITPDPSFLYLSPSHKEALAAAIYGVAERKGFVAIIGEVGVGKTTIVRSFLERMDRRSLKIIHLFNPNVSFQNLLILLFKELDCLPDSGDLASMVNQIHHVLINFYKTGVNIVLVIDEAQNMPVETLQNLHMLSNLESATAKLLQVVFSAQPEFEEKLNQPRLRQLKQRLAIKVRILPLTPEESKAYIKHRLQKVAVDTPKIFSLWAIRRIVRQAQGIPRILNIVCDNCLVTAFGRGEKKVTAGIAKVIISELEGKRPPSTIGWRKPAMASLVVVACAIALYIKPWLTSSSIQAPPRVPSPPTVVATLPLPASEIPAAKVPSIIEKPVADRVATVKKKPKPQNTKNLEYKKGAIPVHRWVKKGETLHGLVLRNYGTVNYGLLQLVRHNNPHIPDVDNLQGGERIYFPSR